MPICPTCQQQVYHAEQIMGPNRQMYHKPCLVCLNCKTRVDPGGLQEHAGKVYCRNCHRMLFSPRGEWAASSVTRSSWLTGGGVVGTDLRSANVYNPSTPPSRPGPSTPNRQPAYHDSYSTPTQQSSLATSTTTWTTEQHPTTLGTTGKIELKGFGTMDDLIAKGSRLEIGGPSRGRRETVDPQDLEQEEEEGRNEVDMGYTPFRVVPRSSVRPAQPPAQEEPHDLPLSTQSVRSHPGSMMMEGNGTGKKAGPPPTVRPKPKELGSGRPLPVPPGPRSGMMSSSGTPATVEPSPGSTDPQAMTETAPEPAVKTSTAAKNEPDSAPAPAPSTPVRPTIPPTSSSSPSRPTWTHSKPPRTPGTTPSSATGDTCPSCEKRVYLMEAVTALSRKWHKGCLKVSERIRGHPLPQSLGG